MRKVSRLFKVGVVSILLGACAPLVLLTMLTKRKLAPRLALVIGILHSVGARLSHHNDSWRREITLYEVITGEMPRRTRR
jgi:hypothetical protein